MKGKLGRAVLHILFPYIKDRQHRSRGGLVFFYIVHGPKGVEYRTIYQMKATISLYPLILDTKCFHVYETNCANTASNPDREILQGCSQHSYLGKIVIIFLI